MRLNVNAASRRLRKRATRRWRVFLNDVDVTNRSFYADDKRGIVRMFWRPEGSTAPAVHGALYHMDAPPRPGRRLYNGTEGVLTMERYGRVRLVRV